LWHSLLSASGKDPGVDLHVRLMCYYNIDFIGTVTNMDLKITLSIENWLVITQLCYRIVFTVLMTAL